MAQGDGTRSPVAPAKGGGKLRTVHDQLRNLIDSLRSERERRVREGPAAAGSTAAEGAPPDAEPDVADLDKRRLSVELAEARAEIERHRAEAERLRKRLAELEQEHRQLSDEYVAVEEQNSELASLFVALERLYSSADRREALAAVQEIVVNMVGSEELGVYEIDASGALQLAHGFGLADSRPDRYAPGSGTVARVAASGVPFVAGPDGAPEDPDLTAAIPLKSAGRAAGVLAIWRLLGHKPFLTDLDKRLFAVLEGHAARPLSLDARGGRAPAAG
jgi:hypothetical protein